MAEWTLDDEDNALFLKVIGDMAFEEMVDINSKLVSKLAGAKYLVVDIRELKRYPSNLAQVLPTAKTVLTAAQASGLQWVVFLVDNPMLTFFMKLAEAIPRGFISNHIKFTQMPTLEDAKAFVERMNAPL